MDSLYDIKDYKDYAKPSDSMGEDDYTQDVFFNTRPDIFDHKDNPYYQYYQEQNDVTDKEKNEFKYNYNPSQYDKQSPPLVNPYKKIKDLRSNTVIAEYRLANEPIVLSFHEDVMEKATQQSWSFYELLYFTSEFSAIYSPKCTVKEMRKDAENRTWSYLVRGNKKDSDPRGHVVYIQLGKDPKEKNIQKLPVKVACSCPFWKWYGPDYNSKQKKYLYEDGHNRSNGQAPNIRDPGRKNKICKHVYAVGKVFNHFAETHDLDIYKEVGSIVDNLNKSIDPVKMEDISALKETLLLNRSEIKEIDPILNKYKKEKNPKKREKIKQEALEKVEDILQNKDKGILKKIQIGLKSFFDWLFKRYSASVRKASAENVIDLYINQDETGE